MRGKGGDSMVARNELRNYVNNFGETTEKVKAERFPIHCLKQSFGFPTDAKAPFCGGMKDILDWAWKSFCFPCAVHGQRV